MNFDSYELTFVLQPEPLKQFITARPYERKYAKNRVKKSPIHHTEAEYLKQFNWDKFPFAKTVNK